MSTNSVILLVILIIILLIVVLTIKYKIIAGSGPETPKKNVFSLNDEIIFNNDTDDFSDNIKVFLEQYENKFDMTYNGKKISLILNVTGDKPTIKYNNLTMKFCPNRKIHLIENITFNKFNDFDSIALALDISKKFGAETNTIKDLVQCSCDKESMYWSPIRFLEISKTYYMSADFKFQNDVSKEVTELAGKVKGITCDQIIEYCGKISGQDADKYEKVIGILNKYKTDHKLYYELLIYLFHSKCEDFIMLEQNININAVQPDNNIVIINEYYDAIQNSKYYYTHDNALNKKIFYLSDGDPFPDGFYDNLSNFHKNYGNDFYISYDCNLYNFTLIVDVKIFVLGCASLLSITCNATNYTHIIKQNKLNGKYIKKLLHQIEIKFNAKKTFSLNDKTINSITELNNICGNRFQMWYNDKIIHFILDKSNDIFTITHDALDETFPAVQIEFNIGNPHTILLGKIQNPNCSYIRHINKIDNFRGIELVELALDINRKLKITETNITDGALYECNGHHNIYRSLIKMLENNTTYYSAVGFEYDNNIKIEANNLVQNIRSRKSKDLLNLIKSNKDLEKKYAIVLNILKDYNTGTNYEKGGNYEYFYKLLIHLYHYDCGKYVILQNIVLYSNIDVIKDNVINDIRELYGVISTNDLTYKYYHDTFDPAKQIFYLSDGRSFVGHPYDNLENFIKRYGKELYICYRGTLFDLQIKTDYLLDSDSKKSLLVMKFTNADNKCHYKLETDNIKNIKILDLMAVISKKFGADICVKEN